MLTYLFIALGGALGSVSRYWLGTVVSEPVNTTFPWGTFWVNVTGCLLIGFVAALGGPGAKWTPSNDLRLFLMTGICGGYTTFSAFSLQTLTLLRAGDFSRAITYVLISVLVCLLATWLGHFAAMALQTQR